MHHLRSETCPGAVLLRPAHTPMRFPRETPGFVPAVQLLHRHGFKIFRTSRQSQNRTLSAIVSALRRNFHRVDLTLIWRVNLYRPCRRALKIVHRQQHPRRHRILASPFFQVTAATFPLPHRTTRIRPPALASASNISALIEPLNFPSAQAPVGTSPPVTTCHQTFASRTSAAASSLRIAANQSSRSSTVGVSRQAVRTCRIISAAVAAAITAQYPPPCPKRAHQPSPARISLKTRLVVCSIKLVKQPWPFC